jgi:hypothetical protein
MIRRLGYISVVLIWLVIMCLPVLAFVLAIRGELKLGDQEKSHIRVFMVQGAEEDGLGIEWSRRLENGSDCFKSSVRYLLWDGDAEAFNVDYCQCFEKVEGQELYDGSCQ